jgi:hypothetical protein
VKRSTLPQRGGVLVLLLLSASLCSLSVADQLQRMSQIEGSNKRVADFLRQLDVPFRTDTAYVFAIPPMNSARIEGTINPFADRLRRLGTGADIIALAVSDRTRAAAKFLERRAFTCDYSRVVSERSLTDFSFSAGKLEVPFVTKFLIGSGELVSAYALVKTDSTTVAWFIADDSRPKVKRTGSALTRKRRVHTQPYQLAAGRCVKLHGSDQYPLSTVYWLNVNPAGTLLSLTDDLTNFIYIFDAATGGLRNVLHPDSVEQTKFVSVPFQLFQWLKQNNVVNSMYFSHAFCDDSVLIIAASLPRVSTEVSGSDTNLAYRNSPVLVVKNARSNAAIEAVNLQAFPDGTPGSFAHKGASFVPASRLAFVPYKRGWPSVGSGTLDSFVPAEENPFTDDFYKNDYQFAVYRFDGTFDRFWGRLSDRFRELKLGYVAGGGIAKLRSGKYYLSDQCSGRIYAYDSDATLIDSIAVFEDQPLVMPSIDRSKEPERYLLEAFQQNFPARIVDFLVSDDYCYALVSWNESQPIVCKVGLKDHTNVKYALPARYQGKDAKHYLLRESAGGIVTASLLESGDETWYCEFRLP